MAFKCPRCDSSFDRKDLLSKHIKHVHERPHLCHICGKNFGNNIQRHIRNHEKAEKEKGTNPNVKDTYKCRKCPKRFSKVSSLILHSKTHRDPPSSDESSETEETREMSQPQQIDNMDTSDNEGDNQQNGVGDSVEEKRFVPVDQVEEIDVLQFLSNKKISIVQAVVDYTARQHGTKWYLTLCIRFTKTDKDGEEQIEVAYFNSTIAQFLQNGDELELAERIDKAYFQLHKNIENFQRYDIRNPPKLISLKMRVFD